MSTLLVMMPVLMLASVTVKLKGILKAGRQRLTFRVKPVDQQTGHDGKNEKDQEKESGLSGEHRQHHEGLIPSRGDHHGHQSTETQHAVRVKRHGGETSDASGHGTEQGGDEDLGEARLLEGSEYPAVRLHVERLDDHHHDDNQAGNQHRAPQGVK